jgi:hypothetical protein
LEHHHAVRAHVAKVLLAFHSSTSCAASFVVSPFCSLAISIASLALRLIRIDAPLWKLVCQREQCTSFTV